MIFATDLRQMRDTHATYSLYHYSYTSVWRMICLLIACVMNYDSWAKKFCSTSAYGQDEYYLEQFVLEGVACGGTARVDLQFVVDGAHVGIDRERANAELLRDLHVGEAHCHKA